MNEHKTVAWFADEPKPNTFFFRSAFRSWKFRVNTAVLAALLFGLMAILFRNFSNWSAGAIVFWMALLVLQGAVYPYIRVLQSHRRIYELYTAGRMTEQPGGSAVNELLSVADNALNDGLFYAFGTAGLLLVFGFFLHLK